MRGIRKDPEGVELAVLDRFVRLDGAYLLEVGCGDGRLTWALAARARRVVAVDPDRHAIASARRATPVRLRRRVRFEVAAAERLRYDDEAFDAAVFSWSL